MERRRILIQRLALVTVVVAVVPYVVIKALWLGGSQIGLRPGSGPSQMHEPRFLIGNAVTFGLELVAVLLAWALTRPFGRRAPASLVLVLAGGATGLLAPILLGLPLGAVIQWLATGTTTSGREGNLEGWISPVVYGGFSLLAVGLAVLLAMYVQDRWGHLLARVPRTPRSRLGTAIGGVGMLPFAAAMAYWGAFGPGSTGPAGLTSIAQRTVLLVTAILAAAGFLAPLLASRTTLRPPLAWLITWVGCATVALQGPTNVLLAMDGEIRPVVVALAVLGPPAATAYGLWVLHATVRSVDRAPDTRTAGAARGGTQGREA